MQPWASASHALLLLWLVLGGVTNAWAFFGLTSRDPVRALDPDFEEIIKDIQIRQKVTSADLCNMLSLHRKHKRLCRRGKGVAETLVRAARLSALECQHQFQHERWNCTLGKYRASILEKSIKETSFMYAMSSAGLVHEFARACAQGTMDRCTCDESEHLENTKTWLWGGCGDNIRFGLKFTRKFLRRSRRTEKDIRAQVDDHNSGAGIKVVRDLVKTTCKCHGVSGSCTVQTCWLQLSPFKLVGNVLKARYERSARVISFPNQATGNVQLMKRQKPGQQKNNIALGRKKRPQINRHRNRGAGELRVRHHESYYYFSKRGRRQRRRNRQNRQKRRRRVLRKTSIPSSLRSSSSSSSSSTSLRSSSSLRSPMSLTSSSLSSSPYRFPDTAGSFSAGYMDAAASKLYLQKTSSSKSISSKSVETGIIPGSSGLDTEISEARTVDSSTERDAGIDSPDVGPELGAIVPLRRSDLTYIEESPSFCRQGRYSPGTTGRSCAKGDNCDSICCGRGYNVQRRTVVKACRCEVIWCCKVKCKECLEQEEIYLCK